MVIKRKKFQPYETKQVVVGDVVEFDGHEYVVTRAYMGGGGTGHGAADYYPDGWRVECRKLNGRKWDPDGRLRKFSQSGCFSDIIEIVKVVGKMEMRFVRVA